MAKRIIVWPEYFDSTLPRRYGRRVPKELAIPLPSTEDIVSACTSLGLTCEEVKDKKYPRTWYRSRGCIVIEVEEDNAKKSDIVKAIARELSSRKSKDLLI